MGSADPRAYSRNKRGIAGSLVWINFDRHALLNLFYKARGKFVADQDEIRPQFQDPDTMDPSAIFNSSVVRDAGPFVGASIDQLDNVLVSQVGGWTELATPWYSDQILPFDITLAAANEMGAMAGAKIFGVEILNEGTGVSIDDSVTETQATFVARTVGIFDTWSLRPFPPHAAIEIHSRQYGVTSNKPRIHRPGDLPPLFLHDGSLDRRRSVPVLPAHPPNRATAPDTDGKPVPCHAPDSFDTGSFSGQGNDTMSGLQGVASRTCSGQVFFFSFEGVLQRKGFSAKGGKLNSDQS